MGEKGNILEAPVAAALPATESLVERVTTTTTETVVHAGEDLATKIRDKTIDVVADETVTGARKRLERPGGDAPPPAADGDALPAAAADPDKP